MKPLRHHPNQTEQNKSIINRLFEELFTKYNYIAIQEEVKHPLGLFVRIDWACIWNKVSNIGKTGTLIATNDRFCIIQITSGAKKDRIIDVYRCEDVVSAAQRIIKTLPV